jgi:diguanylate cyclase (GGDEF)-like protein
LERDGLERNRLERDRGTVVPGDAIHSTPSAGRLLARVRVHWAAAAAASGAKPLSLSLTAWAYYVAVGAAALAASGLDLVRLAAHPHGWGAFAAFTAGASIAQLYIVEKGGNQSYRTAIAFIIAAAVVLRPGFLPVLVIVHYIPGWIKYRKKWLVQSFNIFNTTLAVLAAAASFHAISGASVVTEPAGRYALAGLAACLAFVAVNHVLLAGIIGLTSGTSPRATGLFSFESLSTDVGLAALGIGIAAFWSANAWLTLFVLGPLLIIHRALYVPQLRELAHVDVKTGLLNAKELERMLDAELARAVRTEMPLSVLMVDLDLLRKINNAYGHLAGDVVIRGVADIFREELRRYDVAGRFGGEEFCILLPETPLGQAQQIAERIRETVEERDFVADVSSVPLRATVSIGVATWPEHASGWKELVHCADLAAYRAKAGGRNRVVVGQRPLAAVS